MSNGWVCPTCGYVWGPSVLGCYNCNRPEHEKYSVSSAPKFEPPSTTAAERHCQYCDGPLDVDDRCYNCRKRN